MAEKEVNPDLAGVRFADQTSTSGNLQAVKKIVLFFPNQLQSIPCLHISHIFFNDQWQPNVGDGEVAKYWKFPWFFLLTSLFLNYPKSLESQINQMPWWWIWILGEPIQKVTNVQWNCKSESTLQNSQNSQMTIHVPPLNVNYSIFQLIKTTPVDHSKSIGKYYRVSHNNNCWNI